MSSFNFLLVTFAVAATVTCNAYCQNGIMAGELLVTDGTYTGGYPVSVSGGSNGGVIVSNNSITLKHNTRAYISSKCDDYFQPDTFKGFYFLGRTLSFTADLSQANCACNAALYTVSMPAGYSTSCGDYYCDANNVCGAKCPEMDILEANSHAFQVTPHKCDNPSGDYGNCDGGGCAVKAYDNAGWNSYGPGSNYNINTQQPFQVSTTFEGGGGSLSGINTVVSQNGKSFTLRHDPGRCGWGYLENMGKPLENMVLTLSYWGDSAGEMSWLDIPPCSWSESCNTWSSITFSDIVLK